MAKHKKKLKWEMNGHEEQMKLQIILALMIAVTFMWPLFPIAPASQSPNILETLLKVLFAGVFVIGLTSLSLLQIRSEKGYIYSTALFSVFLSVLIGDMMSILSKTFLQNDVVSFLLGLIIYLAYVLAMIIVLLVCLWPRKIVNRFVGVSWTERKQQMGELLDKLNRPNGIMRRSQ